MYRHDICSEVAYRKSTRTQGKTILCWHQNAYDLVLRDGFVVGFLWNDPLPHGEGLLQKALDHYN